MIELLFELLFEFILGSVICLLEALFEFVLAALVDLILRATFRIFEAFAFPNAILASTIFALLGVGMGALSVWTFPHPLIQPSSSFFGRHGKKVTPLESFRYGWLFAFGVALVRYVFVVRA
jgi:hypothetical protein